MQKIIEYLTQNQKYAIVLYASLAVCAIVLILVFVLRAAVAKKRAKADEKPADDKSGTANQKNADKKNETARNAADIKPDDKKSPNETDAPAATAQKNENTAAEFSYREPEKTDTPKTNEQNGQSDEQSANAVWQIEEENGCFKAKLVTQGGKVLLSSDDYSSLSGVKSGVDTLKNNVAASNYAVNVNRNGKFYFKIFSTANRLLCVSGEFSTRNECETAFESARRASKNAPVKDPD